MTDKERKQFINEYCRNVAHKPMTKLCNTCEYLRYCARSGIEEVGCDRYEKDMTTNEEWLKSLDTEGLVDYLFEVHKGGSSVERQRWIEEHKERIKMQYRGWLKQPHREE